MELLNTLAIWFLVFVSYSVLGWIMEMIAVTIIERKRPANRGFLIGPVCPIYGVGAIFMTVLLRGTDNLVEIFAVAMLGSAFIEYFTSYAMEKIFRVRWWDYSNKPFNLHGRVCLEVLFYFGVLGIVVVKIANPLLFGLYEGMTEGMRLGIAGAILVVLLIDVLTSLWLINVCRVTVGTVQVDATEEITERVREILMGKGKLNRRLMKAFPTMEAKKRKPRKKQATTNSVKKNAKTATKSGSKKS